MNLDALPLPAPVREHFRERGIEELYPPQAAAVEAGVTEGENVVVSVPTASGKTFVAQLAMLTADGPALYVVPLRALATEKYEEFDRLPGVSVGISTGDFDATDEELGGHDVVVATSEKVDSAIRNGADWVSRVACVVVDEIHLLDAEGRGPTLEVTIAKLRRLTPDVQVVGLSATVANADEVAAWLDATLVTDDWRPVDLRTGVYADGAVAFDDGTTLEIEGESPTTALVRDAVAADGQCLVFVHSRREAQRLAADLAEEGFAFPAAATEAVRESATTATGEHLARCVGHGVAFHHAGLRTEHRSIVERAFRDREVCVICATPTLAAGVNVPARRVVVRDHRRYDGDGFVPLPVLEIHQMFGRAGRPGLDPYGEAVIVADDREADEVRERYIGAEPEAVTSKLAAERALRTHVLASVASGFADSREELRDVLASTFDAHQRGEDALVEAADDAVDSLAAADLLAVDGDALDATDLGTLVSRVYVDPTTGTDVVAAIRRAARLERVTPLTVLEIVCDTPDMTTVYLRDDEAGRLSEYAMRNEAVLAKAVREFEGDYQSWLSTLKTARMLSDLARGADASDVAERYGVAPGDLRRALERAAWLLTATESLAQLVDADVSTVRERLRETRERLAERSV